MIRTLLAISALSVGAALALGQLAPQTGQSAMQALFLTNGGQLDEAAVSLREHLTDDDADGYLEGAMGVSDGAAPIGGYLAPLVLGTRTDAWGNTLGYCVWDNGSEVNPGRAVGGSTPDRNAYAVVSAGPDRVFQTRCADLVTGAKPAEGSDDQVRAASQATLVAGFGDPFWGAAVLNDSFLPASAPEGAQRFNLDRGLNMIYREATGWVVQSGLTSDITAPNARYGVQVNGGMPPYFATSVHMSAVADGAGKVYYAGAIRMATGSNPLPAAQSLAWRDTGMLGSQVTVGYVGYSSQYWHASYACPAIVGMDGKGYGSSGYCNAASYQANGATGVRAQAGLVNAPGVGANAYLTNDGTAKYWNGSAWADHPGLTPGTIVDIQSVDGGIEASLTSENVLAIGNLPAATPLAQVRAFSLSKSYTTDYTVNEPTSAYAIRSNGTLWVAGNDHNGQLGRGYSRQYNIPWSQTSLTNVRGVMAGGTWAVAVTEDNKLYYAGASPLGSATTWTLHAGITDVVAAWIPRTGGSHIVVQMTDGTFWGRGTNAYGQLGLGSTSAVASWTRIL